MMWMLAQAAEPYRLFLDPLPVWNVWYLLLLPLCTGIAVVWKSIKCESMRRVPVQAAVLLFWILLTMVLAGAGLAILVRGIEWFIG